MPAKKFDHTGLVYGRLTVKEAAKSRGTAPYWICQCSCGNIIEVSSSNLKSGNTSSCGCLHKEVMLKHGDCTSRLYGIWRNMRARCRTKGNKYHADKGISVCKDWESYDNFKNWSLLNGYSSYLSIDRINGDKDYKPDNCRWANVYTQSRNSVRTPKYKSKSGFTGVYLQHDTGKYSAQISREGTSIHLGSFCTKKEAAIARDNYIINNQLNHFKLQVIKAGEYNVPQ